MSQLVLFFTLQLLGSWACIAVGPAREPTLGMALGFLIGLAIAVFLSIPLLLLGVFTSATVIAMLLVSLAAAVGLAVRRDRATPALAVRVLIWALGFTVLCAPFCHWDVSAMTYDSHVFVDYAIALQDLEGLPLDTLTHLHAWGSFQIIAHALAVITDETHLYALAPAFSLSLLATFAVALHRGLDELAVPSRRRTFAVALVLAALLAIPLVRLHVVYIHANWAAGGYLFVYVVLFWFADLRRDPSYLPLAFLALLAFSFMRVESPMFVAPVLVLTLSQTRLARAQVVVPYLAFTVLLVAWLVLMAAVVPDDSIYLTPGRSLLMAAAIAMIAPAFLARDTALGTRLAPLVPKLVVGLCVAVIAAAAVLRFEVFSTMFPIWQRDLWLGSFWGYFLWPTFAVLAVLSLRVEPAPYARAMGYGIVAFFSLIVLLTTIGDEYGSSRYGSLTRITLHVVPLIWFYFAIVFVPAWSRLADAKASEPIR